MKSGKQSRTGFTLVELMVVAIIVAILAAVAIPLMSGNKNRAAATEAQGACNNIWTAERVYYSERGVYISAATPDVLPGISAGDLNGKYFDHGDYVTTFASPTLTITANTATSGADAKADGISGRVVLTIDTGDSASAWSGTLLN